MPDLFSGYTIAQITDYVQRRGEYMTTLEYSEAIYHAALNGREDLIEKFCLRAFEISNENGFLWGCRNYPALTVDGNIPNISKSRRLDHGNVLNTILFGACAGNQFALIKKCCEIADSDNMVLLYDAAFPNACQGGNRDVILDILNRTKLLLDFPHKLTYGKLSDFSGTYFKKGIEELCRNGNEVVFDVLKNTMHVEISEISHFFSTLIYSACVSGNMNMVERFIKFFKRKIPQSAHETLFTNGYCGAIAGNHVEIYEFLQQQFYQPLTDYGHCFDVACENERHYFIKKLLNDGVSPNYGIKGACKSGSIELLRQLIELGADKLMCFKEGFLEACKYGRETIVQFLLDYLREKSKKFNDMLEFGNTYACLNNQKSIVKLISQERWTVDLVRDGMRQAFFQNHEGLIYAFLKIRRMPSDQRYLNIELGKWKVVHRQIRKLKPMQSARCLERYCQNRFHIKHKLEDREHIREYNTRLYNCLGLFVCDDIRKMTVAFTGIN